MSFMGLGGLARRGESTRGRRSGRATGGRVIVTR